MDDKILICFYYNSIEAHMDILKKFEDDVFLIYGFDNIDDNTLENFNLQNILINSLGKNYKKDTINIISNIESLIIDLFKKYSFEYNSFIFDNSISIKEEINLINEDYVCKYNFNLYSVIKWNTKIDYCILTDTNVYKYSNYKLKNFLKSSKEICENNELFKYYLNLDNKSNRIKEYINKLNSKDREKTEEIIEKELKNNDILYRIYISSFLLYTFKKKIYGDKILDIVLNLKALNKNNCFFIIYQLISRGFSDNRISNSLDNNKINMIYDKVFDDFERNMGEYNYIPKNERNEDVIFVFTSQFIAIQHGPTKTALDRCYNLIKYMNKRVFLINTKELITTKGIVLMDNIRSGSIIEEYSNIKEFRYKDLYIPYYQPIYNMPEENECRNILDLVKKHKPYLMFNIGGYSIVADLASKIAPLATISTSGNYSISKTKGQFFIMGCKPQKSDYDYISKLGYKKQAIIESPFTFDLKPQKDNYSRKDFGIPENAFVVCVIGARLQREIDEEFIYTLDKIIAKGCFVVIIGKYELPNEFLEKYPNMNNNFKILGFQKDILACIDLVDIYINPNRQGGGTSAVECMYKGKPAISLKHGDVSILIEEELLVRNYEEMTDLVEMCKKNPQFYIQMSNKVKLKAMDLMDTRKYLNQMYDNIVNNTLFE
ncbi:hypothetical protein CLPUN_34500 [Clostridium puniceum]|uniref:Glycosyl transferases group 1 n=1 Tax=Clostridium puniceum TaxID=29367 RepID=A0A1S8TB80_9CLOT|nr:glycosyltransferase [Clostridium puniceum]OOM75013.1 hypothetical protein CLPUN_34500 [Clostridium puniceum]